MNQLGDMGNKEKEITTRLAHKEEGRRRQSFMTMPPLTTYAQ
jgi:hypothetical protein